ncbi:MAG: type IV pilin protein [Halioglobus sp.]
MNSAISKRRRESGFTLMELMITTVIVGILMAVALPAYQSQLKRGIRTAAQGDMMDIANRQQQYLLSNRAYFDKTTLVAAGYSLDSDVSNSYTYAIAVGSGTSPTYTITFTPYGAQSSESVLTLNEQGVGTPTNNWDR